MPEIIISAHGEISHNCPHFAVPAGIVINFYTSAGELLGNEKAIPLFNFLTGRGGVKHEPVYSLRQGIQCPDLVAIGAEHSGPRADAAFKDFPTGVWKDNNILYKIEPHQRMTLKEIVTRLQGDKQTGEIHWLCCQQIKPGPPPVPPGGPPVK